MRGSLSQLTRRVLASVGGSHSAGLLPTTTQLRSFNMVPMVLERSQGGERAFDLYSRLLKEGIVFVNGPVNDQMSSLIVAQLLFLESEGTKKPVRKTHTHTFNCNLKFVSERSLSLTPLLNSSSSFFGCSTFVDKHVH